MIERKECPWCKEEKFWEQDLSIVCDDCIDDMDPNDAILAKDGYLQGVGEVNQIPLGFDSEDGTVPKTFWSEKTVESSIGKVIIPCKHDIEDPAFEFSGCKFHLGPGREVWPSHFDWSIDCAGYLEHGPFVQSGPRRFLRLNRFACPNVIGLKWSDMNAPMASPRFWLELLKNLNGRVSISCQGGHGRTGTAICSLLLAGKQTITAKESIGLVRKLYCEKAVETKAQEKYLKWVAETLNPQKKEKL